MRRKFSLPRRGVILILLIAALALNACQPGGAGGQAAGTGGLQAWLDQPPDGSSIPLAAFTLKAHARDIGGPGVQQITFYVNGVPLGTLSTDPTLPLVYAETSWNPAAPGIYTIAAEASNGTSTALSAEAHVCVGDNCEGVAVAEVTQPTPVETATPSNTPEPGVTPSATTVPTNTPTPTPVPTCNLAPPQPASPANGDAVNTPTPTLTWIYPTAACQPKSYQVDLCSDDACATVVGGGATGTTATSWSPAQPVEDCSIYYWRVRAINGNTFGPYSQIFHFATAFPNGCGVQQEKNPPTVRLPNKPSITFYGDAGTTCPNNQHLLVINMDVRDESGVASIQFNYRYWNAGGTQSSLWFSSPVSPAGDNLWTTTVNNNQQGSAAASLLSGTNGTIEIQVTSTDNLGNQGNLNDNTTQVQYCGKP